MMRRPRRNHSAAFKATVARGEQTISELAQQFDVHPSQITHWKDQLLAGASGVFDDGVKPDAPPAIDVTALHAKIGK